MKKEKLPYCFYGKIKGEIKPALKHLLLTFKLIFKWTAVAPTKPKSNKPIVFYGDKYDDHEKTLAEIRKLYEQKMSYSKIANELGMSKSAIARRIAEIRKTA